MDKRVIILRCLYENWPDEVSIIGDDLVTRIVDEVLSGNMPVFQVPQSGFSFDLTPYMSPILQAAMLLYQIIKTIMERYKINSSNNTQERTHSDRIEEKVEEITKTVLLQLPDGIKVESYEVQRLVLRVMHVSSGGSDA
jgi:hypothetical protein